MREIDALLRALASATPLPHLFNQYASDDPALDRAGGSNIRRENLRAYLSHFVAHPPTIIVIGEAAGYRGNRFTGIPFTSEFHCSEHAFLKGLKLQPSSSRESPWRESSASIVWETFDAMSQRPMLWSTVAFHPHKSGQPLTNRAPLRNEIEQGAEHFKLFRRLFPKPRLAATGRIAQAMLTSIGEPFTPVRHPSHGGKNEFQSGLWKLGAKREAARMKRVQLMGILNLTPDSFSDGGKFLDSNAAIDHALRMVQDGAHIIDMGAESTRPGSSPVKPAEQLKRLLPVVKAFRKRARTPISIDTQSAAVAEACLDAGATIVNDISAARHDRAMLKLVAKTKCDIVLMHMQGTPKTMQRKPAYKDVVADVLEFLRERIRVCERAGIDRARIIVDPGIGFGKTFDHNIALLQNVETFAALNVRVLVGISRKRFLGVISGEDDASKRIGSSVIASVLLAQRGVDILRVHDVAEHAQALRILENIGSR